MLPGLTCFYLANPAFTPRFGFIFSSCRGAGGAAAGESGGVDESVVGECGGTGAVGGNGFAELLDNGAACDAGVRGDREGAAGVVARGR